MNRFLEMKERGETILFSELLEDIPPDEVLFYLFPNTRNPGKQLVSHSKLEVLRLRLKGFKQLEIAEQLGLTFSQVAARSQGVSNALYGNVPSYIRIDIPALSRLLNVPGEITGYRLLSELLRDMPSDEKLLELFIERGSIRGGKQKFAPRNRDLQLLNMRAQKQSYEVIGKTMDMNPEEVQQQISLTLRRIKRDLQIEQDVPELPMHRKSSAKKDRSPAKDDIKKKNLSVLSERQREVWLLYEQGLNRKEIAEKLGITYNAVREHILHAERRFREYERYCVEEEGNQSPVFLPMTRGEVKIILEALKAYEKELEHGIVYRPRNDWVGRLPFEAKIVADLFDRAQKVVYGEVRTRMPKNWDKDK